MGKKQVPAGPEHVAFRLIDEADAQESPNLALVPNDAARTVADLRAEGHTVLLHCVAASSRMPSAAIRYSQGLGVPHEQAVRHVRAALPHSSPNAAFRIALGELGR